MRRKIHKLLLTGMLLSVLCLAAGCGKTEGNNMENEQNTVTPAPTESPTPTPIPLTEEEQIHLDMLERSVISTGNNERMK